jgi:hypothetical protein
MIEITGKITDVNLDFKTGKPKLTLEINDKQALLAGYDELKNSDKLSIKLTKYRKKRSLNANNYAWKLITDIAENQGISKEDVYRQYIKDIGVCRQVEIDEKAVDTLIHSWSLHGIGWVAEKLDYGEHEGFILVNLYYGSSTYNTQQMSRLINNIVQDCEALGIQTKTPDEIANLLSLWKQEV